MSTPIKLLLFLIVIFSCLGQIGSDIYTPALPAIAREFGTNISKVQWSMAVYMLGITLSVLIYGSISEAFGRRLPLLIGLVIMTIGTIICLLATQIDVLILGRFIQGCGVGACMALWRSIFRDSFTGLVMAKYASYLGIIIIFVVPAAPTLGGYLQQYMGWRSIFAFLLIYSLVALFLTFLFLKETSQHHNPQRLKLKFIKDSLKLLLSSRIFMGYTLCVFFTYGAFFSWFVASPVLLIHLIGLKPVTFGWISLLVSGGATALGNLVNARLLSKWGVSFLLQWGWALIFLAG